MRITAAENSGDRLNANVLGRHFGKVQEVLQSLGTYKCTENHRHSQWKDEQGDGEVVEQGQASDYLRHIRGSAVFVVAVEMDDQGGED